MRERETYTLSLEFHNYYVKMREPALLNVIETFEYMNDGYHTVHDFL